MGRMARKAPLLANNGSMVDGNLLTLFLVAVKTKKIPSLSKKVRIFRSMGGVTSNALAFFKRTMFYTSTGFQFWGVVTIVTEFAICFSGAKRFGIGR
jgi:hypothetical protein